MKYGWDWPRYAMTSAARSALHEACSTGPRWWIRYDRDGQGVVWIGPFATQAEAETEASRYRLRPGPNGPIDARRVVHMTPPRGARLALEGLHPAFQAHVLRDAGLRTTDKHAAP
jgi:hypothetical protein